jgi:hypothetical protein
MISNSEFCLQIDSHSLFVQDWDVVALEMWGSINNEYAILSTQVPDLSYAASVSPDNSVPVPHLCEAEWANRGIVRNKPPKVIFLVLPLFYFYLFYFSLLFSLFSFSLFDK